MLTNVREVNLTELGWDGEGCYSHFTGRIPVGQWSWRLHSRSCWKPIVQAEAERRFPKQRSSGILKCKLHSSETRARKTPRDLVRCLRHHRIMTMCCGTCFSRLWLPLACLKVPENQQTATFRHTMMPWGHGQHPLPEQPVLQLQFPGWLHLSGSLVGLREGIRGVAFPVRWENTGPENRGKGTVLSLYWSQGFECRDHHLHSSGQSDCFCKL